VVSASPTSSTPTPSSAGLTSGSLAQLVSKLKPFFAPLAAIPWFFAGGQRPSTGQRAGSGVYLLPGAVAVGTPTALPHKLGRTPVCVRMVDNGVTAEPLLQVTARSATSVTVVPTVNALDANSILYLG